MRRIAFGLVVLTFVLGTGTQAYAQIAADPLVQVGSINLQTGAYSALEERGVRLYGVGLTGSSSSKFTAAGRTESDTVNGERVGVDYNVHDVVLSLGYQEVLGQNKGNDPSAAGGLGVSSTSDNTQDMAFLAASFRNGRVVGEVRFILVSEQISAHTTVNTFGSFSGSESQSYIDAVFGMSADVTEHIRAGFNFSPEVNSSGSFGGTLAQFHQSRSLGHGAELRGSIAYNRPSFTVSVDAYRELEDDQANFAATQGSVLHAGYLFAGTFLITGDYEQFYQYSLVENNQSNPYFSPAIDVNAFTLGAFLSLGGWVVGAQAQQQQQQAAASYGNAVADSDRFQSGTAQLYILSILKVL